LPHLVHRELIDAADFREGRLLPLRITSSSWPIRPSARELWFYPTIGAAIAAGVPWLTYSCPACQQVGAVDLRTLDRHPGAAISSVIPSLSCRRCSPNAPFAKLEMRTGEQP
jgi:hypothetical protein